MTLPVDGPTALRTPELPLPRVHGGKVREVYSVDEAHLLMVASDRVSAFDVVMAQAVPHKGRVLTQITAWWLDRLAWHTPHHLVTAHPDAILERVPVLGDADPTHWRWRAMLVRATSPLPIECVVRGYLAGSAWKEYAQSGTLAGEALPRGLQESQKLDRPIFSPATKAQEGHDENITFAETAELIGAERAKDLRDRALRLYGAGSRTAEEHGILLADTKFEFGLDDQGRVLLIDEVLTPDSSRYWPADTYEVGGAQASLDKQPVRDFLDGLTDWNKQPPPPELPSDVVRNTTRRYREIFRRLTGQDVEDYEPPRTSVAR
jgi:phosphoribosylaminoimidazole-succinocarboxamide synthase